MKPAALLALLLLVACTKSEIIEQAHAADQSSGNEDMQTPRVYKDRATGCEYLSTAHDGGLYPRIAENGFSHRGCKTPLLEKE